jgi:hypothetical protein
LTGTIGFAVAEGVAVAVDVGAGCPSGITIGVDSELPLPPLPLSTPPFKTSFGGQD